MHWEHRMPAHSIIFVRSGKLVIEGRDRTDEITAGNYVFVRRDCSVNMTKVPLDGKPYQGINFSLPRHELKEYYNRIAATCKKLHHVSPIALTVNILPQVTALKSLFDSFLPYTDSTETPSDEWLRLKVQEAVMSLLAIDTRFYPTLFDFSEAWKIDLMDFMEQNYTEDLTLEEFASYTGRSLATFKRDFAKISPLPPTAVDYGAPIGKSQDSVARKYRNGAGCRLYGRIQEQVAFLAGFQEEVRICTKQLPQTVCWLLS